MNARGPVPHQAGIGWRHPHYAQLLETRPALGFVEVHSENFFGAGGAALAVLQQARAHYPLSLHGVGLGLGSAIGVDGWHLDQLARLVERTEPWLVSDHACFARAPLPDGRPVHATDLLPIPFNHEALDTLCTNVQHVQDRLQRSIAVENLSAYLRWDGDDQTEPEFLTALARRTGCRLLVDVNNLYVNALNDLRQASSPGLPGLPPQAIDTPAALARCRAWLDAIPGEVVAELHLAGHADGGDIVIDDHGSRVCDAVWSLHHHALQRFGPVPTLIEWDTDIPALQVLLDEAALADQTAATLFADEQPA